eukprot:10047380-Prorocentrum_lima.AAC.1
MPHCWWEKGHPTRFWPHTHFASDRNSGSLNGNGDNSRAGLGALECGGALRHTSAELRKQERTGQSQLRGAARTWPCSPHAGRSSRA